MRATWQYPINLEMLPLRHNFGSSDASIGVLSALKQQAIFG
jgi:hypothetical protein